MPQTDTETLLQAQQQLAELGAEHSEQEYQLAELQQQLPVANENRRNIQITAHESERQLAQAEARLRARFEAAAGPTGRLTRAQARAAGLDAVARALDEQGAPPQASLSAGGWLAHLRAVQVR